MTVPFFISLPSDDGAFNALQREGERKLSVYYYANVFLCWTALGVLCLLVHDNARITLRGKRLLYLTYALIALSSLAEMCGVYLDGREALPRHVLLIAKCADYILTPMAGGALIFQLRMRNRWNTVLIGMLIFNTLLQLASVPGGWMVKLNEHNHYTHGPLYPLYLFLSVAIVLIVLLQFMLYGRSFRRQNRLSMYGIIFLTIAGIAIQELSGAKARTEYIALTFSAAMLFIHYTEFASLEMDDHLLNQQIKIDTDALTGVFSRYAYSLALKAYDEAGALPRDLAAFSADINGLKQVNDSLGHEAGDELIRAAAECIRHTIGVDGKCYRTGGDEFVVLTAMKREDAENALRQLKRECERWRGNAVKSLSISAGYALASDFDDLTAEALVRVSDKAMYEAKSAYYRGTGKDRRNSRSQEASE